MDNHPVNLTKKKMDDYGRISILLFSEKILQIQVALYQMLLKFYIRKSKHLFVNFSIIQN